MAKGIYVGVEERVVTGDIIPKEWTESTDANWDYVANDGTLIRGLGRDANPLVNAFDGSSTTYAQNSSSTANNYIAISFSEKRKITKMKLYAVATTASNFKSITIRGSDDQKNWTTLYETTTAQTQLTEITLNSVGYYQYYRLDVNLTSTGYMRVYEWQTSEYVVEDFNSAGVAHKVKAVYVGVNGVARKAKKGYIGVNGVAKLFYDSATYIPFTVCPYRVAASSWVSVKNYTEYTYTDDYGVWRAKATGTDSSSNPAYYAFDTSSSTSWKNSKGGDTLTIEFPKGVTIKPTQIKATGTDNTTVGFNIYGVKTDGTQEQLVFYDDDQSFSETFDIKTDSYFTKLVFATGVDGTRTTFVKQFFVENGTIRID